MSSKMVTCPYCFNSFENTDVLCQCENEDKDPETGNPRCARVTNKKFDEYWRGSDLPIGNYWRPKRGLKSRLFGPKFEGSFCPQCYRVSRRYICPHCLNWLPVEIVKNGGEIISVIGSPSSGKTNYIVALIKQLRKYGYRIGIQPELWQVYREGHKDEATSNMFKANETELFTNKTVLRKTKTSKVDVPWIVRLYQPTTNKSVYIVFYDSAGEKFQINVKNTVKYLKRSAGVIMLLDTLSVDFVKDVMEKKELTGRGGASANYEEIVTALTNFKVESGSDIDNKPFAFVFSKFDAILDNARDLDFSVDEFMEGDRRINSELIENQKLDLEKIDDISEVIEENMFDRWDLGPLGHYALNWSAKKGIRDPRNKLNKYKFFGVSALGCMPDENGNLKKVEPYRVLDPLLWILHRLGQFELPIKK